MLLYRIFNKETGLNVKRSWIRPYQHNLNTSRSNYPNICTTHTYEQRVNNIHMLQDLGFEICSGGIIGMGESKEDVVDMLFGSERNQIQKHFRSTS